VAELLPGGEIREYVIRPEDAGLREASFEDIASRGTAEENARVVARALAGKEPGPLLDVLLLNAAAGLKLMGKVNELTAGVEQARRAVGDGRAIAQLRALVETQSADPRPGLAKLAALIAG
jgi:anthranilate phosphoribosyltransferase